MPAELFSTEQIITETSRLVLLINVNELQRFLSLKKKKVVTIVSPHCKRYDIFTREDIDDVKSDKMFSPLTSLTNTKYYMHVCW